MDRNAAVAEARQRLHAALEEAKQARAKNPAFVNRIDKDRFRNAVKSGKVKSKVRDAVQRANSVTPSGTQQARNRMTTGFLRADNRRRNIRDVRDARTDDIKSMVHSLQSKHLQLERQLQANNKSVARVVAATKQPVAPTMAVTTPVLTGGHLGPSGVTTAYSGVMMKNYAGRAPSRHEGKDTCNISAYGQIGEFSIPATAQPGDAVFIKRINPSLFLDTEFYLDSRQYEKWMIERAQMTIQPLISTLANGALCLFFHTDPDDAQESFTGLPIGYSHKNSKTMSAGVPTEVNYPGRTDWLYTDIGDSDEPRTSDAGYMVVLYMGGITDSAMFDKPLWSVGFDAEIKYKNRRLAIMDSLPFVEVSNGDESLFRGIKERKSYAALPHSSLFQGGTVSYSDYFDVSIDNNGNITLPIADWFGYKFYIGMDLVLDGTDSVAQLGDIVQDLTGLTVEDQETGYLTIDPIASQVFSWFAVLTPIALATTGLMSFSLAQASAGVLVQAVKIFLTVLPEEVDTLSGAHSLLQTRCLKKGSLVDHFSLANMRYLTPPQELSMPQLYGPGIISGFQLKSNNVGYSVPGNTTIYPINSLTFDFQGYQCDYTKLGNAIVLDLDTIPVPVSRISLALSHKWTTAGSYGAQSSASLQIRGGGTLLAESAFNTSSTASQQWACLDWVPVAPATTFSPGIYDLTPTLATTLGTAQNLSFVSYRVVVWGQPVAYPTAGLTPPTLSRALCEKRGCGEMTPEEIDDAIDFYFNNDQHEVVKKRQPGLEENAAIALRLERQRVFGIDATPEREKKNPAISELGLQDFYPGIVSTCSIGVVGPKVITSAYSIMADAHTTNYWCMHPNLSDRVYIPIPSNLITAATVVFRISGVGSDNSIYTFAELNSGISSTGCTLQTYDARGTTYPAVLSQVVDIFPTSGEFISQQTLSFEPYIFDSAAGTVTLGMVRYDVILWGDQLPRLCYRLPKMLAAPEMQRGVPAVFTMVQSSKTLLPDIEQYPLTYEGDLGYNTCNLALQSAENGVKWSLSSDDTGFGWVTTQLHISSAADITTNLQVIQEHSPNLQLVSSTYTYGGTGDLVQTGIYAPFPASGQQAVFAAGDYVFTPRVTWLGDSPINIAFGYHLDVLPMKMYKAPLGLIGEKKKEIKKYISDDEMRVLRQYRESLKSKRKTVSLTKSSFQADSDEERPGRMVDKRN